MAWTVHIPVGTVWHMGFRRLAYFEVVGGRLWAYEKCTLIPLVFLTVPLVQMAYGNTTSRISRGGRGGVYGPINTPYREILDHKYVKFGASLPITHLFDS